MKSISVSVRAIDVRRIQAIMRFLDGTGLVVGKCTVSEAVRYSLGMMVHNLPIRSPDVSSEDYSVRPAR